ncbi:MAG: hypothetical protein A2539_07095 [Elusimicrobia bacterium RIFOXYD2_FULL_34_15]|nr:MAG: hypothetical protein A2539_07095 [Elusimicrobia bacterium RIFOXYD2_FULL_34_15]
MLKLSTAIGSLPHFDAKIATEFAFNNLGIPIWPQLPKRSFKENMYIQYSEGIPYFVVDEKNQKVYFDLDKDEDVTSVMESFYLRIIADDLDYFKISQEYAAGFYEFINQLEIHKSKNFSAVKGHIIGPITFGLKTTDKNNRSIFYDDLFIDVIVKTLTMKARWQIRQLSKAVSNSKIIIFLDEPYLSAFGSAFTQVSGEQVIKYIGEVNDGIHKENALSGVHCCGNTDWSILMDSGIDIISFDAYNFFDGMSLYPEKLNAFLQKGGILAWGIVPSSDVINSETVDSLCSSFKQKMEYLIKKGINEEKLKNQYIITPSCGVGSLDEKLAEKIIITTKAVAEKLTL